MFRTQKTKIVSTPLEEVLEVEEPMFEPTWEQDWPDEDPWEDTWIEEEPELQQISNIEYIAVEYVENEMQWGKLTNYDGYQFSYQWDTRSNRIVRLVGNRVDKLVWDLCDDVLRKYYVRPEPKKVEEPLGPQIEQAVNNALTPVANAFKNLDSKVEKALTAKPAPAPAPVQAAPAPRPQTVQSAPMPTSDVPAINVADNDISANAMRFLQESNVQDLGIDYMSL